MKKVIERSVIIHPSFRRGMFPTSNQERRVGIMVFKLDKREMISPGELRAFYRNKLRELIVKRPAQDKHRWACLESAVGRGAR